MINGLVAWLTKYKILFEVFAYIVLGFAGLYVSYNQYRTASLEHDLNVQKSLPLIKIETNLSKSDTASDYDTETLKIINEGESLRRLKYDIKTFYRLIFYSPPSSPKTFFIPVQGYYVNHFETHNFKGVLTTCYCPGNNRSFGTLYSDVIKSSESNRSYSIEKVTIVQVDFMDISKKWHGTNYITDPVRGAYEINQETIDDIYGQANRFKDSLFDFNKLTFEKIKKITIGK